MKIGIIGMGSIGQRHYENARTLEHECYGYDPKFRVVGSMFGHETDLYDWCDAAVICSPSSYHESGLRACVERRKHVLIEKPISTAIGQMPELLALAKTRDLVVMMGNNLRFHPCVRKAKMWLASDLIGRPLWANFQCAALSAKAPYLSDGIVLNTGAHEVDLALHLFGPAMVVAAAARVGPYGDDIADFVLHHETGCMSSFHIDFVTRVPLRMFRIVGADGGIFCDLNRRDLSAVLPDDKLPGVIHSKRFDGDGSWDDDYIAELSAFVETIEGSSAAISPAATGNDGLAALRVLLDVRRMAGLP